MENQKDHVDVKKRDDVVAETVKVKKALYRNWRKEK